MFYWPMFPSATIVVNSDVQLTPGKEEAVDISACKHLNCGVP